MGRATSSTTNAPTRSISPKPKISQNHVPKLAPPFTGEHSQTVLLQVGSNDSANLMSSHVVLPRLRPTNATTIPAMQSSPAVTIDPPSSPPKSLTLNLMPSTESTLLAADGQRASSGSGSSSPRTFKIPSRPTTPQSESRRAPSQSSSQPPEPPPPRRSGESRRSGELRRDTPAKMTMGPPPPVNRSEKPKIPVKQTTLSQSVEDALLPSTAGRPRSEQTSPFTTPPSFETNTAPDPLPKAVPRTRPASLQAPPKSQGFTATSEAPPIHNSLPRRLNQEFLDPGQYNLSPQPTGDLPEQRPALPTRPLATNPSPRSSLDVSRPPANIPRSAKNGSVTPRQADNGPIFAAPPKRIFSTPVLQSQTPSRAHGRSLTADPTIERAPGEFRGPSRAQTSALQVTELLPAARVGPGTTASSSHMECLDLTVSNRRLPHLEQSVHGIPTGFDTRLLDVCGDFVCTSGQYTRVWNLHNGDQVIGLTHGETVRILSVAFKAAADPDAEGSQLWLGNNVGELLEVEIAQQGNITAKANAHNRREVIKIFRHLNEMWTLDDGGTLNIWGPDATGLPNLEDQPKIRRVPKGHTFSMVVDSQLWYATGKDIRIFEPGLDESQFQVLQRPLSQPEIGEVTSGTSMNSQPDRVYFGHNDGKVSIYSRGSYSCLGTVNVSVYKINSLTGVGQDLWAAYNSGYIYIYDTTQSPWSVKKYWRAHENPAVRVLADRSSFWKLQCQQVISLGADNMIRTWDGLLEEDWLGKNFDIVQL